MTFLDWDNYIDDQGNARTLDWSVAGMRGASPYPYVAALMRAAENRDYYWDQWGWHWAPGLAEYGRYGARASVEVVRDVQFFIVTSMVQTGITPLYPHIPVAGYRSMWIDPRPDLSPQTVYTRGQIAVPYNVRMALEPDEEALFFDIPARLPYYRKFGIAAEALLVLKKVLATLTRRITAPLYVPADENAPAIQYLRTASGDSVPELWDAYENNPSTDTAYPSNPTVLGFQRGGSLAVVDVGEDSVDYRYSVGSEGQSWTGALGPGPDPTHYMRPAPFALRTCRILRQPYSDVENPNYTFSFNQLPIPDGSPPFLLVEQAFPCAASHTWTQHLGFQTVFPDYAYPDITSHTSGHREWFAYIQDFAFAP